MLHPFILVMYAATTPLCLPYYTCKYFVQGLRMKATPHTHLLALLSLIYQCGLCVVLVHYIHVPYILCSTVQIVYSSVSHCTYHVLQCVPLYRSCTPLCSTVQIMYSSVSHCTYHVLQCVPLYRSCTPLCSTVQIVYSSISHSLWELQRTHKIPFSVVSAVRTLLQHSMLVFRAHVTGELTEGQFLL